MENGNNGNRRPECLMAFAFYPEGSFGGGTRVLSLQSATGTPDSADRERLS